MSRRLWIKVPDTFILLQYFEKIKELFDIQNIEQLKKMIAEYIEKNKERQRGHSWDYEILPLENVIDPNKIGTVK